MNDGRYIDIKSHMRRKLEKKMTMCSALIGDHEGMNRYIRCDPILLVHQQKKKTNQYMGIRV